MVDTAYIGIRSDYSKIKAFVPMKKPRGKELTNLQREQNRLVSSQRIHVEHVIGHLKSMVYSLMYVERT
jgi:hypothetical protein